jgi:hypothetical protein
LKAFMIQTKANIPKTPTQKAGSFSAFPNSVPAPASGTAGAAPAGSFAKRVTMQRTRLMAGTMARRAAAARQSPPFAWTAAGIRPKPRATPIAIPEPWAPAKIPRSWGGNHRAATAGTQAEIGPEPRPMITRVRTSPPTVPPRTGTRRHPATRRTPPATIVGRAPNRSMSGPEMRTATALEK